jgi:predicted negative regulator of RcsB-dependent stress response
MNILVIILSVLVIVLGFTTWNLLRKVENQEDALVKYQKLFIEINKLIKISNSKINDLDNREVFKSDDEIGWFFNYLKEIQNEIKKTFKIL